MSKKNKMRYQSRGNQFPPLFMTGKLYLRHRDEEAIAAAAKGDLQLYLSTDALAHNTHVGDYGFIGYEGYLKAEIHDGKGWKPLSLEEFFPGRDYFFSKRERPIDTCGICVPELEKTAGVELMRTYREHYVKAPEGVPQDDEE